MKRYALTLLAATLLLGSCNQNPPATEQSAPAGDVKAPEAGAADASEAAPGVSGSTNEEAPAAAAKAAQPVDMAFRFEPMKSTDGGPARTMAYLVLSGGEAREIDLGPFAGKPDQVDAAEAKRANFPGSMLLGFRSYDPNSGTSNDLAVLPSTGGHVRIVQRRLEEGADKQPEFQTSREISVPAGAELRAAAPAKAEPAKKK
ncbi:hypothetical protein LJ737_05820 [Hymenobacter sp. 15J16-1T3B]|uniref:hypothetical protein n=1 Tax=Hymenobacter sp. 15J16-1T3B TaxID=2886941 RepID=UPI001D0F946D|nr:hypothetical protein [Hymenobacter sp. 15J16-1T3B]MCC3156746.1 hypothetical protein [Hymenobacter sp. 15J16-1T3B]